MLTEVRKLVFSDDLLQQALVNHCKTEGIKVPHSQIQKIRVTPHDDGSASVVMEYMTANPNQPYEVHLNQQAVLTAMIAACRLHGVPLPRDAAKTVQMTDQGVAMTVSMKLNTFKTAPPNQAVG